MDFFNTDLFKKLNPTILELTYLETGINLARQYF